MKKLLVLFVAFLIGASVFATENWIENIDIGLGIPLFKINDEYEISSKGHGVNFLLSDQLINKNNGFLFEVTLGFGGIIAEDYYGNESASGFDFEAALGIGYAFKHDSEGILSAALMLGYDIANVSKSVTISSSGYSYNIDLDTKVMAFFLGTEISGTLRMTDKVGLFGRCLFAIPLGGFEEAKAAYGNYSHSEIFDVTSGGYFIRPAAGLSITLD